MQEPLPNELLIRIFGYVEAADYASAIRMSSWTYHRDLNIRSRGWAMRRVSFDVHTCRLVCRKWNILVLPRVYSQVTLQPTRWDSFMNLLTALPTTQMALAIETVALNQFPTASLSNHLQTLLSILSSLKEVKIFRPTRLDQANNAPSTLMTGSLKQLSPTLGKFTVCDTTLDDGALVQLVRCVQLFSHINCFYMSDVSFVGDIERGSAVAPFPRATTQIGYLDADSTNPLIARNILYQANCVPLPSKLSVRLAYNPRWMLSLADLLSLYATTQFASQNQLADLTLTVEPLGYYSPILQVDVDSKLLSSSGSFRASHDSLFATYVVYSRLQCPDETMRRFAGRDALPETNEVRTSRLRWRSYHPQKA